MAYFWLILLNFLSISTTLLLQCHCIKLIAFNKKLSIFAWILFTSWHDCLSLSQNSVLKPAASAKPEHTLGMQIIRSHPRDNYQSCVLKGFPGDSDAHWEPLGGFFCLFVVDLQCFVGFRCSAKWFSYIVSQILFHYRLLWNIKYSSCTIQ